MLCGRVIFELLGVGGLWCWRCWVIVVTLPVVHLLRLPEGGGRAHGVRRSLFVGVAIGLSKLVGVVVLLSLVLNTSSLLVVVIVIVVVLVLLFVVLGGCSGRGGDVAATGEIVDKSSGSAWSLRLSFVVLLLLLLLLLLLFLLLLLVVLRSPLLLPDDLPLLLMVSVLVHVGVSIVVVIVHFLASVAVIKEIRAARTSKYLPIAVIVIVVIVLVIVVVLFVQVSVLLVSIVVFLLIDALGLVFAAQSSVSGFSSLQGEGLLFLAVLEGLGFEACNRREEKMRAVNRAIVCVGKVKVFTRAYAVKVEVIAGVIECCGIAVDVFPIRAYLMILVESGAVGAEKTEILHLLINSDYYEDIIGAGFASVFVHVTLTRMHVGHCFKVMRIRRFTHPHTRYFDTYVEHLTLGLRIRIVAAQNFVPARERGVGHVFQAVGRERPIVQELARAEAHVEA